jgi:transcriptional regulator with XRE-family HTH domain
LSDVELFGRRLATLRRRAGLTQSDVAAACNVTVQAVSKWECGRSCPDALMLERIASAIGRPIQELFARGTED